jgi:hypothetical protein
MTSKRHQFILGLIIKKIVQDGFTVRSIEGKLVATSYEKFDLPPKILRHRPDVIAVNEDGQICIGEAKTERDLYARRTKEEFLDFSKVMLNGKCCILVIGIPATAKNVLEKIQKELNFFQKDNIQILYVPEEIING